MRRPRLVALLGAYLLLLGFLLGMLSERIRFDRRREAVQECQVLKSRMQAHCVVVPALS
jgi:hypothetical protein